MTQQLQHQTSPERGHASHDAHQGAPHHRPRRRRRFTLGAASLALAAGVVGGGVGAVSGFALAGESSAAAPSHAAAQTTPTTLDVHQVLAKVEPAVVTVRTRLVGLNSMRQPVAEEGTGTGVVVHGDGVIVTNYHVVSGAETIQVELSDGRVLPAQVLGTAPGNDLAVLKIDATGLPTAQLGDSNSMQVGDPVVAIGNALALPGGPTVTEGIVSALDRTIQEPDGATLHDVMQTDAAINPGNSGGPLVDAQGRVIAINTATASQGQDIGFAIALSPVEHVIQRLEQGQSVGASFTQTPGWETGGQG